MFGFMPHSVADHRQWNMLVSGGARPAVTRDIHGQRLLERGHSADGLQVAVDLVRHAQIAHPLIGGIRNDGQKIYAGGASALIFLHNVLHA